MAGKDYYRILGVAHDADSDEIKKAYRKLAMQCHPDRNPGDRQAEERFKEASEAYSVLGNADKRKIYDQYGVEGLRAGGAYPGADFSFFSDSIFSDFSDILGDLFGFGSVFSQSRPNRPRGRSSSRPGRDLGMEVTLTLEEAYLGKEKEITVEKEANCPTCGGNGSEPGKKPRVCRQCNGSGSFRRNQGFFSISTTCNLCNGSGEIITDPCHECKGKGRIGSTRTIQVSFPAGIDEGNRLRVAEAGEDGFNGGRSGDLYLLVRIAPHEHYRREDNDLILDLDVSFSQAALGAEIVIETFAGEERIKIPAEIQSGHSLKIKGKGFKNLGRFGRGDLIVVIRVRTPSHLSAREKELFRELQKLETVRAEEAAAKKKKGLFN